MTRAVRRIDAHNGMPDLPLIKTDEQEWFAKAVREGEELLRARGVRANHIIHVLKPLGHKLFNDGSTVYHHILRAQTMFARAYTLNQIDVAIAARIIHVGPA